jgi:hypothetical protein
VHERCEYESFKRESAYCHVHVCQYYCVALRNCARRVMHNCGVKVAAGAHADSHDTVHALKLHDPPPPCRWNKAGLTPRRSSFTPHSVPQPGQFIAARYARVSNARRAHAGPIRTQVSSYEAKHALCIDVTVLNASAVPLTYPRAVICTHVSRCGGRSLLDFDVSATTPAFKQRYESCDVICACQIQYVSMFGCTHSAPPTTWCLSLGL